MGYLYLLPGLVLILAFVFTPLLRTGWLSFFRWDGVTPGRWIGLGNYVEILADAHLRSIFLHSLVLVGFFTALPIGAGLLITALLTRRPVRGMTLYRAVLFVPQAVALVVIAVAWKWMYHPTGVVNQFLGLVGIPTDIAWLGSFTLALPAVGLIGSWMLTGFCMVLFLSGVQKIDPELYAAARVDGASATQEFRFVTLPGLRAELVVAVTITVVIALRTFDLVYILTRGGPGTATSVPGLEIFLRAFNRGQVGSASSLAVVLTVLIVGLTLLIMRLARPSEG